MPKVHADITMSLDGYVAGRDDSPEVPLGQGGERLHEWVYGLESWRASHGLEGGERNRDGEILEEAMRDNGAVVIGRRMFDNAHGWGDEPPFKLPVFVLTHEAREPLEKKGGTTFTFVTDGIESAVEQAKAAAGERNVSVGGGASTIQQCLSAGLLDELQVHVAPLLLGGGVRLFADDGPAVAVELTRVVESPRVAHLRFRVVH